MVGVSVEDQAFKLLRSLIKVEGDGIGGDNKSTVYKDLYRLGLQAKMKAGTKVAPISVGDAPLNTIANKLLQLHVVLSEIAAKIPL
jgi:hypothetical protein